MIRKLGKLDSKHPPYHRPNDPWSEVVLQTDGDTQAAQLKQRSLRQQRSLFTWSVTAFTIGVLLIVLSSPYRLQLLAPGALSSAHAPLLANQGKDGCAACHAAADQSLAGWLSATFFGQSAGQPSQSELCLRCHDQSFDRSLALQPHNLAAAQLQAKTSQITQDRGQRVGLGTGFQAPLDDGRIACSTCHREHHDSDHDLVAMTDRQCQICHQDSIHAFELDHPEFTNYPTLRNTGIEFNHQLHAGKYFPEAAMDFNCSRCHQAGLSGRSQKLVSFELGCASCHDQPLKLEFTGSTGAVTLFALPLLDMEAIEAESLSAGTWPLSATGDFDGKLPPLMQLLLSADPQARQALGRQVGQYDFSNLDPTNRQDTADAVTLTWAIKRLLLELANQGSAALAQRLSDAVDREVDATRFYHFTRQLDPVVYQQAANRWLPGLENELVARFPNLQAARKPRSAPKRVTWRPSDDVLMATLASEFLGTPFQQEQELLAENPLKSIRRESPGIPIVANSVQEGQLTRERPELRPATTQPPVPSSQAPDSPDRQLLAINPLNPPPAVDPVPPATGQPPRDSVSIEVGPESVLPEDNRLANPVFAPSLEHEPTGWFRDDQRFVLAYRPQGHADEGLQALIDFAAAFGFGGRPESATLYRRLLHPEGLGNCRQCHKMNAAPGERLAASNDAQTESPFRLIGLPKPRGGSMVSWRSTLGDSTDLQPLTRFSHAPHLLQPGLRDCQHCHQMGDSSLRPSDSALLPTADFLPIQVTTCSSCHRQGGTRQGCTVCHQYHAHSITSDNVDSERK